MSDYALHIGHRKRLKEKLLRSNTGSLADYEILETLLFYSIPRKDVKPLEKSLLKKYHNIGSIINVPSEELKEILNDKSNLKSFIIFYTLILLIYYLK